MTTREKITLNIILKRIEVLEAKQWNFTITFEENVELTNLVATAEKLIS